LSVFFLPTSVMCSPLCTSRFFLRLPRRVSSPRFLPGFPLSSFFPMGRHFVQVALRVVPQNFFLQFFSDFCSSHHRYPPCPRPICRPLFLRCDSRKPKFPCFLSSCGAEEVFLQERICVTSVTNSCFCFRTVFFLSFGPKPL